MLGENTFAPSTVEKINSLYVGKVNFGDDSKIFAVFSLDPFLNDFKSKQAGINVYDEKLMLTLHFVGDKSKKVYQAAGEPDKKRFKEAWEAFQLGEEQIPTGTALKLVNWVTKTQMLNLSSHHIHTVEQLADISDVSVQSIGLGGVELRKKAQAAMEARRTSEPLIRAQAERDALRAELDAMKAKSLKDIDDIKALIGSAKVSHKRGPRKKVKEVTGEAPFAPAVG